MPHETFFAPFFVCTTVQMCLIQFSLAGLSIQKYPVSSTPRFIVYAAFWLLKNAVTFYFLKRTRLYFTGPPLIFQWSVEEGGSVGLVTRNSIRLAKLVLPCDTTGCRRLLASSFGVIIGCFMHLMQGSLLSHSDLTYILSPQFLKVRPLALTGFFVGSRLSDWGPTLRFFF